MNRLFFIVGLLLSLIGLIEVSKISQLHFMNVNACPNLGIIPACYVVFISYAVMTFSWSGKIISRITTISNKFFWFGFFPAFALAVLGSSGEIFGFASCPKTESGFPKCFISLAFVSIIGFSWFLCKHFPTHEKHSVH